MKGYTILETLITLAILVVMMMTVAPFLKAVHRGWESDDRLSRMLQDGRLAMEKMAYELKSTNALVYDASNTIDASNIIFGTSGDEMILDDRNSGFSTALGVWSSPSVPGGFAGDFLRATSGVGSATYRWTTIVPGPYDFYAFYLATAGTAIYDVYDNGISTISSIVNQSINAVSWYHINDSDVGLTTGGNDRLRVILGSPSPIYVDAIKLVYRGTNHKVFSYDSANSRIHYRASNESNATTNILMGPQSTTTDTDAPQVYPFSGATGIFKYYQMDGVTEISPVTANNVGQIGLIRIAFELRDPQGKAPPYKLTTEVRRPVTTASRRLVINEINYMPPGAGEIVNTFLFDDMDGGGELNGVSYSTIGWYRANNTFTNNEYDVGSNPAMTGWRDCGSGCTCDACSDQPAHTNTATAPRAPWVLSAPVGSDPSAYDPVGTRNWGTKRGGNANTSGSTYSEYNNVMWPRYRITRGAGENMDMRISWAMSHNCASCGSVNKIQLDVKYHYTPTCTGGTWVCAQPSCPTSTASPNWTEFTHDVIAANEPTPGNFMCYFMYFKFTNKSEVALGTYFDNIVFYDGQYDSSIYTAATMTDPDTTNYEFLDPGINCPNMPWGVACGGNPAIGAVGGGYNTTAKMLLWEKGTPTTAASGFPSACRSGKCWGTLLNYLFPDRVQGRLESPNIDLGSVTGNTYLSFWHWRNFGSQTTGETSTVDGGIVEISTNGGTQWEKITNFEANPNTDYEDYDANFSTAANSLYNAKPTPTGTIYSNRQAFTYDSTTWILSTADITAWANYRTNNTKIRFRAATNEPTISGAAPGQLQGAPGWYLDDITVYGGAAPNYEYIELYNPTPYPIDLNNYRVVTETSYKDADDDGGGADAAGYDTIQAYSAGSTTLQPYKYAIVAADGASLYTGSSPYKSYIDARVSAGDTIRLQIVDGSFGANNLNNDYGKVTVRDSNGNLIDYVGYNLAFYDDMETAAKEISWSKDPTTTDQSWERGDIDATNDVFATDHSRQPATTGFTWGTNVGGNYPNNVSDLLLYTPSIDISGTTTSTSATLSWWQGEDMSNDPADDYGYGQISSDGGTTYTTLTPIITGAVPSTDWENQTRSLAGAAGTIITIRFVFTEDNDGTVDKGWYLDDVAVYWNWGANANNKSLERVYWKGDSRVKSNWLESVGDYGTPGGGNSRSP